MRDSATTPPSRHTRSKPPVRRSRQDLTHSRGCLASPQRRLGRNPHAAQHKRALPEHEHEALDHKRLADDPESGRCAGQIGLLAALRDHAQSAPRDHGSAFADDATRANWTKVTPQAADSDLYETVQESVRAR